MTPIGARIQIALDAEYLRMQNEWFFKWHHIGGDSVVEIDGFDGRKIIYGGIKFSGTARSVYWEAIQRYARKKVGQLFDELEVELQKYPLEIRPKALNEARSLIRTFVAKIRQAAVEKDRILRGNGIEFPSQQDLGTWNGAQSSDIESRAAMLQHIYCDLEPVKGKGSVAQQTTISVTGDNSRVTFGTDNSSNLIKQLQPSAVAELVEQIKLHVGSLPEPQRTEIAAPLELLEDEIRSDSPKSSRLQGALRSIQTIVEGAGGNLVAAGIQTLIAKVL